MGIWGDIKAGYAGAKKQHDEKQKAEAICYALQRLLKEFHSALALTADVYDVDPCPTGDYLAEGKYLAVLLAFAISSGAHMDAEQETSVEALAASISISFSRRTRSIFLCRANSRSVTLPMLQLRSSIASS